MNPSSEYLACTDGKRMGLFTSQMDGRDGDKFRRGADSTQQMKG